MLQENQHKVFNSLIFTKLPSVFPPCVASFPSPCIFHFFLSIVSNIFLSIVSRVFLSIVSKYFFAPLVVLALTNVPCLTLSPRKNPKHHFLNFIMTRKSEAWFNENLRKGKYKKASANGKLFFLQILAFQVL